MASINVKVKVDLPTLEKLKEDSIANTRFQAKLGRKMHDEILDMVEKGISPVSGEGRFKAYQVDREVSNVNRSASSAKRLGAENVAKRERARSKRTSQRKDLYPNSVKKKYPSKQRRPVNLKLSGDMLDALWFKGISGGIKIGLIAATERIKTIFRAHNDQSDPKRRFPRRAILPTGLGETFVPKLMRIAREEYLKRIREIIREGDNARRKSRK